MSEDIKRSISLSCGDLSAHDVAARHRAAATNIFNVFFIRILFELKPFLYFRPFKAVAEQAVLEESSIAFLAFSTSIFPKAI